MGKSFQMVEVENAKETPDNRRQPVDKDSLSINLLIKTRIFFKITISLLGSFLLVLMSVVEIPILFCSIFVFVFG